MALRDPDPLRSVTFTESFTRTNDGRADRRRVRDNLRARADKDAHARAILNMMPDLRKKVGEPSTSRVSAVFRRSTKVFVEGVAGVTDTVLNGADLMIPSGFDKLERADLSLDLMFMELARQQRLRYRSELEGMHIAIFHADPYTGRRLTAREANTAVLEKICADRGMRKDAKSAPVREQIKAAAADIVPKIATWKPEFNLYYASPEQLEKYEREYPLYENHLRQFPLPSQVEIDAVASQAGEILGRFTTGLIDVSAKLLQAAATGFGKGIGGG